MKKLIKNSLTNQGLKFRAFTKLGMIYNVSVYGNDEYEEMHTETGTHFGISIYSFESQVKKPIGEYWEQEELEQYDFSGGEDWVFGSGKIMQFTGLKSYKFNTISEEEDCYYGDIIRFSDTEGKIYIKEVWWSKEFQSTMIGNLPYYKLYESAFIQPSKLEFEILGNIYENQELLDDAIKL